MFAFFTILFLIYELLVLMKGLPFYNKRVKIHELELEKHKEGADVGAIIIEQTKNFIPIILTFLVIGFAYFIYLISAIEKDVYKYPTLLMLALFIFNFIKAINKKAPNLSTEEGRNEYKSNIYKKRTVKSTVMSLIGVAYFTYMLLFAVFKI
jgi:large-conductance mechanosensitive channel